MLVRVYSLLVCAVLLSACHSPDQGVVSASLDIPVNYVDPLIGTGTSTTISALRHSEADNEPRGQTFPAVGFPFGMTQWTPQTQHTEIKCISPYYHQPDSINGFRGSHWMSGSCTQDYGSVTLMPLTDSLIIDPKARGMSYDRTSLVVHPYKYMATFPNNGLTVELAGHKRSGIMRFIYSDTPEVAHVLVEPNSDEGVGYVHVDTVANEITGYNPAHRIYQGWGQFAGFNGYFVAQFNKPFISSGVWKDSLIMPAMIEAKGDSVSVGAFARFAVARHDTIYARIGTSFTSIEAARANLEAEIPDWDLDSVVKASSDAWNTSLSSIKVTGNNNGGSDALVQFYTAHYHAMMLPRLFNDVSGSYPGFAGTLVQQTAPNTNYYADYSVWDTYRAVHPLLTITDPGRAQHMVQSLVNKAEQGGWLPIFPSWNNYTAAMIGDHVTSIITDAYTKGLRDFDVDAAYGYMHKNATEVPDYAEYVDGKGRRALLPYLDYGYLPLEEPITEAFHKEEQVSRTLEYAFNDFNVGILADALGLHEDARIFLDRSLYYKNIIDPETGIARGRYRDGSWYTPFDPAERTYEFITEGSPWHYTWYVPHDVAGLIEQMGGREMFIQRLDHLFEDGEYWHGNEPSHQIAYLYAFAGVPWKSQHWIRQIMEEEYSSGPGGLSGNDDAGQMSAWYVFSALGFYPVSPGLPYYVIGTPSFEEVTIKVSNGEDFIVRANEVSKTNKFIQSATLNGVVHERPWILHDEIMAGGTLIFEMGPEPNTNWGRESQYAPPSLSTGLGAISIDPELP